VIDMMPRHQLGYVLPVPVGDYLHYQFYRVCPPDCSIVCIPLGLESFTPSGADAAFKALEPAVDFLIDRQVDRISQGGIPISALVGRKRVLTELAKLQKRTKIPITADFEETLEGLQHLGLKRVAVAAKWDDQLMNAVTVYLKDVGIETVGLCSEVYTAAQVTTVRPQDGYDLALALGRKALKDFPKADGLLLAGGAWLSLPAAAVLEAEFGKPVVTNPIATYWGALRQFGRRTVTPGFGRLLDSLT
jgi:arylmalonate decarboxylase